MKHDNCVVKKYFEYKWHNIMENFFPCKLRGPFDEVTCVVRWDVCRLGHGKPGPKKPDLAWPDAAPGPGPGPSFSRFFEGRAGPARSPTGFYVFGPDSGPRNKPDGWAGSGPGLGFLRRAWLGPARGMARYRCVYEIN